MCQSNAQVERNRIVIHQCTGGDGATTILTRNRLTNRWHGMTVENDGSGEQHHNHQQCLDIKQELVARQN